MPEILKSKAAKFRQILLSTKFANLLQNVQILFYIRQITEVFQQLWCLLLFRIRNGTFKYVLFLSKRETFAKQSLKFQITENVSSNNRGVLATCFLYFYIYWWIYILECMLNTCIMLFLSFFKHLLDFKININCYFMKNSHTIKWDKVLINSEISVTMRLLVKNKMMPSIVFF